jgi:chromosome segregation ATPase
MTHGLHPWPSAAVQNVFTQFHPFPAANYLQPIVFAQSNMDGVGEESTSILQQIIDTQTSTQSIVREIDEVKGNIANVKEQINHVIIKIDAATSQKEIDRLSEDKKQLTEEWKLLTEEKTQLRDEKRIWAVRLDRLSIAMTAQEKGELIFTASAF